MQIAPNPNNCWFLSVARIHWDTSSMLFSIISAAFFVGRRGVIQLIWSDRLNWMTGNQFAMTYAAAKLKKPLQRILRHAHKLL